MSESDTAIQARFDEAVAAHQRGDLPVAVAGYRNVLALDPSHAVAANNLGTAHKSLGQMTEAIAAYQRAVDLNPAYAAAVYNLGTAYQATGNLAKAFSLYWQANRLRPHDVNTLLNLASLAEHIQFPTFAADLYAAVRRLSPGNAKAVAGEARCLGELGRSDEALALMVALLAEAPGDATYWYFAGDICVKNRDWERAATYLRQAQTLAPAAVDVTMALARVLHPLGAYSEMRALSERVVAAIPDFGPAYTLLSLALQGLGLRDEAAAMAAKGRQLPGVAASLLKQALGIPQIPGSQAEIARCRSRFFDLMDDLATFGGEVVDPVATFIWTPSFFTYHGENDSAIAARLAEVQLQLCPTLAWVAPHCQA